MNECKTWLLQRKLQKLSQFNGQAKLELTEIHSLTCSLDKKTLRFWSISQGEGQLLTKPMIGESVYLRW